MAEEILINVSPRETRVAVLEQGLLQQISVERSLSRGIVGNIYKARVIRILPGLQSAFVDFGHEKAGFIHVTDLFEQRTYINDKNDKQKEEPPRIESLLRDGQVILIQVTKEPIGTKGARVTTTLSLASRFLVYTPNSTHIGVSQKIEDENAREDLRNMLNVIPYIGLKDGFIARTAAELAEETEILRDGDLLRRFWDGMKKRSQEVEAPCLLYEDLPLHLKVMRDLIGPGTDRILVDAEPIFKSLAKFLQDRIPLKKDILEFYCDQVPIFDMFNVEDQIQQALDKRVPLKSGGYLIIEQTEAMATIDVNTGGFLGRKDLEETIYRINLEAAHAIPRQLRLRNMGGILILDFIDMMDEDHKRQVLRILEKGILQDRVKCRISEISELGLVEMTRKRSYESLSNRLCELCPMCDGRGTVKTAETITLEIFREIQRHRNDFKEHECLILASQSVVDRLVDEDAESVSDLSHALGIAIRFQVEATYSQEQFDVVSV